MLDQIAETVSRSAGVKIHPRQVERVLGALALRREFWPAVTLSRLPVNTVAEIIKELLACGLATQKNGVLELTARGKEEAAARKATPGEKFTCPQCSGRGIDLSAFDAVTGEFQELVKKRPGASREFDQGYVTPQTTVARVAFLAAKGDIAGRDLIVLGDDDLVSVAAALSGLPRRVAVLEIDPRLVAFVQELSAARNLKIEVYRRDIRAPLPKELCRQFDTFFTDPPETVGALELFISRGLAALKGPCCAGYFGLTYAESSLADWLAIQQILAGKLKVAITDIVHDFNEYVNWDYLLESVRKDLPFVQVTPSANWYRSSLYRIETIEDHCVENLDRGNLDLYPD